MSKDTSGLLYEWQFCSGEDHNNGAIVEVTDKTWCGSQEQPIARVVQAADHKDAAPVGCLIHAYWEELTLVGSEDAPTKQEGAAEEWEPLKYEPKKDIALRLEALRLSVRTFPEGTYVEALTHRADLLLDWLTKEDTDV